MLNVHNLFWVGWWFGVFFHPDILLNGQKQQLLHLPEFCFNSDVSNTPGSAAQVQSNELSASPLSMAITSSIL